MESYDKLSDKIWMTRKCRINTSERLLKNDFFTQLLVAIYTLAIIVASVISINSQNNTKDLSLYLVLFSMGVLVFSLFVYANNYKERALELKRCYIELDRLILKINIMKEETEELDLNAYESISDAYLNLLSSVENHSIYDYYKILLDTGEATWRQSLDFYIYQFITFLFKGFLLLLPAFLLIKMFWGE